MKKGEEAKQEFIAFLRKKKLKVTQERLNLIEWIFRKEKGKHFNADDLFFEIKQADVNVSRATIYRTLDLMVEARLLRGMMFGGKTKQYELHFDTPHHDHLVCLVCGTVIEFTDPRIEALQNEICDRYAFTQENHVLQIRGICETCREQATKTDTSGHP